jgi:hypothetical protein
VKTDKKEKPKEAATGVQRAEEGRLVAVTDGACRIEIHPSDLDRFVRAGWRRA